MVTNSLPVLYSFRRCPYAMRARLGILFAGLQVELREVVLRDKPAAMLNISPKGTVPVLKLKDQVIDESRDILMWALSHQDPQALLQVDLAYVNTLIDQNDNDFKYWLDRYKYFNRYPEHSQLEYRQRGEAFLQELDSMLAKNRYLLGATISVADIAVMPFVRQFAHVDRQVFYQLPYPNLQQWLQGWLQHDLFLQAMVKQQPWAEGAPAVIFG